jgi:hypothetical protein
MRLRVHQNFYQLVAEARHSAAPRRYRAERRAQLLLDAQPRSNESTA